MQLNLILRECYWLMAKYQQKNLFEDDKPIEVACSHRVRVAIEDSAVEGSFDYLVPDELWPIEAGQRVKVPFGRGNRTKNAFCLEVDTPATTTRKLKMVDSLIDQAILLDDDLMELARWLSSYYVCPIGQVFAGMIPSAVKKSAGTLIKRYVYLCNSSDDVKLTAKQKIIYELLEKANAFEADDGLEKDALLEVADCGAGVLKTMAGKGLLKVATRRILRELPVVPESLAQNNDKDIVLNAEQAVALEYVNGCLVSGEFGVSLLHGVTDSGKTEVYIRAIEKAISLGKSAIVLLPEIALTAQTIQRFACRFDNIAVMHSGLTAGQRNVQWQNIKSGKADVVIGARSAVFAPLDNLGLIVVDEEHEPSYKQDVAPRYNARDVAVKRSQICGGQVLLGSATPSLESIYNCEIRKHYKLLVLPNRVKNVAMPTMQLVDMKEQGGLVGRDGTGLISAALQKELEKVLERKEQAILLLNRRGYSNFVFCSSCKHTLHCRNCDVTLTFHKSRRLARSSVGRADTVAGELNSGGYAVCHYCQSKTLVPRHCPMCSKKMTMIGLGSQRLEEELLAKFGGARIMRVDSDSMQAKDYYDMLRDFGDGKIDILAGTQMLAKGLHFPNVTLVGIISADTALTLPDFRANERTFQLINQVAGRAGRGDKPGKVVVQSLLPEQPVIDFAMRNDFAGFVEAELECRKMCNLPPFGKMVIVHLRDEKFQRLQVSCEKAKEHVDAVVKGLGLEILVKGPMESPIARLHGQYRNQMVLESYRVEHLQELFARLRVDGFFGGATKVIADVDPVNLM